MTSRKISGETKAKLRQIYDSLNPAQLKREIDKRLNLLYQTYRQKQNQKSKISKVEMVKKLKTRLVRKYIAQPEPVSVR